MENILGAEKVISVFGKWPSFHDAEILELHLNRSGPSWIKIHLVDSKVKDGVVTFTLEDVTDLELADFSRQNVISSLTIERVEEGLRLILSPCYGIAGWIQAARIKVTI